MTITVTLYTRADCPPCDQARQDLDALQEQAPHRLVEVDVSANPALLEAFGAGVPIVEVGPYRLKTPFTRQDLQVAIGAARDRRTHLEEVGDERYKERVERGKTLNTNDRMTDWMSRRYMLLFNLLFFVYVGLPFLAPVLMKVGAPLPAKILYTAYSPLCHQLSFRSWFLFGEQDAYPRAIAGVPGLLTYGQASGFSEDDFAKARSFTGNPQMGYKVALCERDVAIYGAILVFGLIFAASGRRLRSLPIWAWLLFGILPIGLDGFSQLLGTIPLGIFSWIPVRESTPLLRTITGALFGFTTAWFGYPYVEETMREARQILARKKAIIAQS